MSDNRFGRTGMICNRSVQWYIEAAISQAMRDPSVGSDKRIMQANVAMLEAAMPDLNAESRERAKWSIQNLRSHCA